MERKKRSKGRGWESCYVKQIYGTFGVEMRAYGQKLVQFCKHTHTHVSYSSIDAWRQVEGVMSDRDMSKKLKGNVLGACVTPAMLYGLDTLHFPRNTNIDCRCVKTTG